MDIVDPHKDILFAKHSSASGGIPSAEFSVNYLRDRVLDNIKTRTMNNVKESRRTGAAGIPFSRLEQKAIDILNLLGLHVTGLPNVINPDAFIIGIDESEEVSDLFAPSPKMNPVENRSESRTLTAPSQDLFPDSNDEDTFLP